MGFVLAAVGSISACAEAPPFIDGPTGENAVYLRVCGGTFLSADRIQPPGGLSPRVRRHLDSALESVGKDRSISACAEAPSIISICSPTSGVYLRVCGGTGTEFASECRARGLSPRVRRHRVRSLCLWAWVGSISACAEAPEAIVYAVITR